MELNTDEIVDLFNRGHFEAISRGVGSGVNALLREREDIRVVVAHAFVYTGKLVLAQSLIEGLDRKALRRSTLAEAHIVTGLVLKREGKIGEAAKEFHQAASLARADGDRKQLAWAKAQLFRLLLDGHPDQHLTALLSEVRRCVASAGDPHISAYLHDSVAVMEIHRGHSDEASRHLDIANNLLRLRPNAWLQQLVVLNESTLAYVRCDAAKFKKCADAARALSEVTGHAASDAALDANDAHSALAGGHLDRARAILTRLLRTPVSINIELAALETMARMLLVCARLEECAQVLQQFDERRRDRSVHGYSARSAAVTRVKLLGRQGKWDAASHLAKAELTDSLKVNDLLTVAKLKMLLAEALYRIREHDEGSRELADASSLGASRSREYQAEYFSTCGRIVEQMGGRGYAFVERSSRIWQEQKNRCGLLEAATIGGAPVLGELEARVLIDGFAADSIESRPSSAPIEAVGHLAVAFDLAYSPSLLAQELLAAIHACDISPQARIAASRREGKAAEQQNWTLEVGNGEAAQTIICPFPREPFKVLLLNDVARISRAASALRRSEEEERARAALWPQDAAGSEGEHLFVSSEMQALSDVVRRIAGTTVPVLITGETGTGKEVLARAIHNSSNRAKATFLPFNCSATPKDMLDSQLFGHRRGAFTGANENFPGVIRTAAGGTLFLDEIGDMRLDVQPKLLRFLESSEVHPVGETQPVRADVRVIAATNSDLETLLEQGRFREDLFYRLNIVRLHVPPLRERRVEIPALANHYLRKHAQEYEKADLRIAEETMEYLVLYRWPGNVRQLANEMRRLAALAEPGAVLMPEHLAPEIATSRRTVPASARVLDPTEVVVRLDQPLPAAVEHVERALLQYALRKCGGRMEETASLLGLSRKGLYLKRQRFGLEPPSPGPHVTAEA